MLSVFTSWCSGKKIARKCYVWGERREVGRPPEAKVLVFSCLFRKVTAKSARFAKRGHTLIHEFFLWTRFCKIRLFCVSLMRGMPRVHKASTFGRYLPKKARKLEHFGFRGAPHLSPLPPNVTLSGYLFTVFQITINIEAVSPQQRGDFRYHRNFRKW